MNIQSKREVIAVIGGGSVGVSFLSQLVDMVIESKVSEKIEIMLFEPQEIVGPGYAYQADFDCNILNTNADTMAINYGDKGHFIRWLNAKRGVWENLYPGIDVHENSYLPRGLFGLYVNSIYQDTLEKCKQERIFFKRIQDIATDIVIINKNEFCIDTEYSGGFICNRVVLSIGNIPSNNFKEMHAITGYFNNPYPCSAITNAIEKNDSVCIIGTNLSAIDTVLSLRESGHKGAIICASRNGRFPSVRGKLNKPHKLKKLTKNNIDEMINKNNGTLRMNDVIRLLVEEYELKTGVRINIHEILNSDTGIYNYLLTEIKLSISNERFWQSIIYATNDVIDYVWHKLSIQEKTLFNKFFRSKWMSYRVSFPLENALKIQAQLRDGQLNVFDGMQNISYDNTDKIFHIEMHSRKTGLKTVIYSNIVVNATSYSLDVINTNNKLVQNLLSRKIAKAHEFGGFVVDYSNGCLINQNGVINQKITALGSLTTGVYFWTNAMEVNARLAKNQATSIVNDIKKSTISILNRKIQNIRPTESGNLPIEKIHTDVYG